MPVPHTGKALENVLFTASGRQSQCADRWSVLPPAGKRWECIHGRIRPGSQLKQLAWQVGCIWVGGKGLSPRMGQGSSKQGQSGCAAIRRVSRKATFSRHFGQMFNDVLVGKKSGRLNLFPFPFFLQTLWSLFLRLCLIWGFTFKSLCQDRDPVSWSEAQLLAA